MANEISLNLILSYTNGNIGPISLASTPQQYNINGLRYVQNIMTIPTGTITSLVLDSSFTPGYCVFCNTDLINFVNIYAHSADNPALKLKAGEWALFRWASAAIPAAEADTAPISLQYFILED